MSESEAPRLGLETRLSRLETIVATLEREELELERALELFEEGIGHVRAAQALIRDAELRVERLVETAAGALEVEPLERSGE